MKIRPLYDRILVKRLEEGEKKKGGMTVFDGVAIVTALILIAAIILTDHMLGTEFHKRTCAVCAEVCADCAKSCEGFDDMQECAEACRRCAESCRRMAA